jgi:hypothetical protein
MTALAMLVGGSAAAAVAAEPEFNIGQPAPGSLTNKKLVQFKGTGVGPVVELYISKGVSWGSPVWTGGAASGKWETSQEFPDGQYTALAVQRNPPVGEGEVTGSSEVAFTIDTVKPVVSITPVPPRSGTPPERFSGTVSNDGDGDEPSSVAVRVSRGGETVGGTLSAPVTGTSWSVASPPLTKNGEYTVRAVQRDVAGNEGSAETRFELVLGTPTVRMVQVPSPSNNATPTLHGSATLPPVGAPTVGVTIRRLEGAVVGQGEAPVSGGEWSYLAPHLPDGEYTAQAVQKNEGGGKPAESEEIAFTIDTQPPPVSITTPANGALVSTAAPTFSGASGHEDAGDLQAITLKVFPGSSVAGSPTQVVSAPAASGAWSASVGPLSNGIYTAVAEQPDTAGNVGTSTVTFVVVAPVSFAGLPPVASFQWIPAAPYVGQTVSLVSNSTDATSPITGWAWDLTGSGLFNGTGSVVTTSFSSPGKHVVHLRVTDANGLSTVVAETIPVTVAPIRLVQPFPVVRIAGTQYRRGVRISLLSVQAPVGAHIGVVCRGPGCPSKAKSQQHLSATHATSKNGGMALIEFRRFELSLRAGAVLEIRVSVPGQIGKYTRFAVRRGKLPTRFDSCLDPTGVKPIPCPTS